MGTGSAFLSCLEFSFPPATFQLNLRLPNRSVPLTKSFCSQFWKRALQSGCWKNTGAVKRSGQKGTVSKARQLGSDFQPQETLVLPETPQLKRCLSAGFVELDHPFDFTQSRVCSTFKSTFSSSTPSASWTRGRESKSFLTDKFRSGGPQALKLWLFYIALHVVVTSPNQKIIFAAASLL